MLKDNKVPRIEYNVKKWSYVRSALTNTNIGRITNALNTIYDDAIVKILSMVGIKAHNEDGTIDTSFKDELKERDLVLQISSNSIELHSGLNGILCRCEFRTEISHKNECYSAKIIEEWS